MKTDELREKYLSFFETKGHTRCPSDVLVPTWDPSVLFTPAGMNQFKDHFLGRVKLDFTKATTCQKCLRTGDIDNVGRTAYHHTFFEMLGNFSFGDYFKEEAIHWAWEFLTDKKWLAINPDQLSVTVYKDDDEAANIWHEKIGLPFSRIERLDEDENFWPASAPSQGPDGVCGPCSEIYFTPADGKKVEIWNLVFTQFNRVGDPPNNLEPLPSKNIDTGMGLERTAATLQGVTTNYHIDILRPIVEAASEICGVKYDPASDNGRRLRRITDHIRACTMAVHENVYPGANKEKYVIRRLLRRAVLDGHQMGMHQPFAYQLVDKIVEMMKTPYPDLQDSVTRVKNVIKSEEENFLHSLDDGIARSEKIFSGMRSANRTVVNGDEAAELYQTFGFPPELFEQVAIEHGFTFDWVGYKKAMEEFGERSGGEQVKLFETGPIESLKNSVRSTEFVGYDNETTDVTIKGIVTAAEGDGESQLVDDFSTTGPEHKLVVVLDKTPFYGESGGQVGDKGRIYSDDFEFIVTDTQKDSDLFLHEGYLAKGTISTDTTAKAQVDTTRRAAIKRAHSATHILHHALQKTLGSHAQQQGSKVEDDLLRFDFTNMEPIALDQLTTIESDVNAKVVDGGTVKWETVPLAKARELGAMMLFGEKYPDPVRMVTMGDFSRELCGGTHLTDTKQVEAFEVISEESVSAGVRRIIALTGDKAKEYREKVDHSLDAMAKTLKCDVPNIPEAVRSLTGYVRDLKKAVNGSGKAPEAPAAIKPYSGKAVDYYHRKEMLKESARLLNSPLFESAERVATLYHEVDKLKHQLTEREKSGTLSGDDLLAKATTVGNTSVVVADVPGANANLMRQLIDQIRKSTESSAVMLFAAAEEGKVTIVAGLSKSLTDSGKKAGDWVKEPAAIVGGSGGGRPDMAQAGGKDAEQIPAAMAKAEELAKTLFA
ncbi:alanine--tRNA ligase [Blastopirellula marina]|uniref:Alanine--tRNA ligase n=1 Tax=Blastopirellula marina TaxID=124 RepID=A0A2S8G9Y7_9BACT|nr:MULTISPECIES: alanine--tRNA ligase [Pirellulaceae]PQO41276.1 alanine--tRNA ligase [Blastopirellula marina]RCS56300.1 alanine--tRNA ligase [Bremerella cremea]